MNILGGCRWVGDAIVCSARTDDATIKRMECFDKRCEGMCDHVVEDQGWYGFQRTYLECGGQSNNDGSGWIHQLLPSGRQAAEQRKDNIELAQAVMQAIKQKAKP